MNTHPDAIKSFWDSRADAFKTSGAATLPERAMHALEIKAISRHLADGLQIADIGCGNGYSTLHFARAFRSRFYGVDYSERMIHYARQSHALAPAHTLRGAVRFLVGDAFMLPFESGQLDRVITERCVQNILSWELQARAIGELLRVLRPGGLLIMAECSQPALDRINHWRRRLGRATLDDAVPWHNLFLDDQRMRELPNVYPEIAAVSVEHFSSSYMFLTRILPLWRLLYYRGRLVIRLPNIGQWGYFKLFLIEKR